MCCNHGEVDDAQVAHAAVGATNPFQPIVESQTRHVAGFAHRPWHGQFAQILNYVKS